MTTWWTTSCTECGSRGVAQAPPRSERDLWRYVLSGRCPDCGTARPCVRSIATAAVPADRLPAWAQDLLPADVEEWTC